MRKMYSEEQVKKIAETAVATALAEMGVEANNFNGIDVDGLLTAGSVSGGAAAFASEGDPTAYIGTDATLIADSASLGFDPKEAMSNLYVDTQVVRIGGLSSSNIYISGNDISISSDNQVITINLPTVDPLIEGALWYDTNTYNVKMSTGK